MNKVISFILIIFILVGIIPLDVNGIYYSEYDSSPLGHDLTKMTSQELAAEMKYAIKARNEGKYFPQDRLDAIEKQLVESQKKEVERYQKQLKTDAENAKKIEDLKQKAIDKAKEKGEEYYEKNKEKIQKEVENQAKKMLNISTSDWDSYKTKLTDMYENGSKVYEEKAKGYVEVAQKAYDAFNAYNKAKTDNPELPDTAQNLIGVLNATKEVLGFAGDKMSDTPLRPVGEILKAYGEACSLGDTAGKTAWKAIHKDGVNPNFKSQYTEGLNKVNLSDLGLLYKTPITNFDSNIRVIDLGDNRFAAFDKDFNIIPGSTGNTLTPSEYKNLEKFYQAYDLMKKDGWPKLTTDQLVKLAKGEKIKVKTKDNWVFSDEFKEFSQNDILEKAQYKVNTKQKEEIIKSIDRILNGEPGMIGSFFDGIVGASRRRDIRSQYYEYLKTLDSTIYDSDITHMMNFMSLIQKMKEEGKSWKDIKKEIKRLKKEKEERDKEKEEDKDKPKDKDKDKEKNPLDERIKKIEPNVKKVDSSGLDKDNNNGDNHWVDSHKDEFSGNTDSGFTRIGNTYRPLPDPNSLGIPVLKPNIYIYTENETRLTVDFENPEDLLVTIPEYNKGWDVMLSPGSIFDDTYSFLFYEAEVETIYFQSVYGLVIDKEDREKEFKNLLSKYNFNEKEIQDFIEFWMEKLENDKTYVCYPQHTDRVNMAMPVDIKPEFKDTYRIWFMFEEFNGNYPIEPVFYEKIERSKSLVVEWGGMVK